MNFELTNEQKMFQKTVREFCEKELKPLAPKIDKEEYFPWDLVDVKLTPPQVIH